MEVHHHSHSSDPDLHRGLRKKWTHYFWEFLMLFLAVFCGFLAEYQLEHKIEKDREKQYLKLLVEDLRADSSMLELNYKVRQERIYMIDSLILLMNTPDRDNYTKDIYFFARSISPPMNIFPNDGTIQQLKSSGSLRLIRNKEIVKQIMAYDQKMRNVLFEMGDEVQIRAEYRLIMAKVFNASVLNEMVMTEIIKKPTSNPRLYSEDPALVNQFIAAAQYIKRVNQAQLIRSIQMLDMAKELKQKIKKEYHLK
ncbi:MAG: hypothetical protein ACXWCZ_09845 [Flavisolibacter sp.]